MKLIPFLGSFVVALVSLQEPFSFIMASPTTRPHATPLIVAHRGASFDAPENTLSAFRLGWQQSADAIEGDFYLTRDGRIVCNHDATLKRTGDIDRRVADLTLDEVRAADVGSWKDAKYAGEPVPTIEEVLALVPPDKFILIEIKCGPEIIPALRAAIDESKLTPAQLRIIAFDAEVIAAAKKAMPRVKAFWLTEFKADKETGASRPTLDEVLATLRRVEADGLDAHANPRVIDADFVAALRAAGHEVHLWTIDDPDAARRFAALGIDSITTNRPRLIRDALRDR